MVAKTLGGLEEVLAEELRGIGAENVEPGRRSVSFEGDLSILYRANMCCRTALRILKPIYTFTARDTEQLYERIKEYDWSSLMTEDSTFAIDSTVYSETFRNSRFVTYRVKDAIVDQFTDRLGEGKRPGIRLTDADILLNVHIAETRVTVSLDSSGESLHKRGYRVASTEAPINEVLAAGIILKSGWRGESPFVDPMCGSGTFVIEAAMIAAGIMPGIYRKGFAFERWADYDRELFDSIYNDDSAEKTPEHAICGCDISPKAIAIATRNVKQAGLGKYITLKEMALSKWSEAPEEGTPGVLVTNPPYGERIAADDMNELYKMIGTKLKHIFKGYHAWIIGYKEEYFHEIGLSPSMKEPVDNGGLECELREYIIFDGDMKSFKREGGSLEGTVPREERREKHVKSGERKFDGERRERKFDGERRERRFDGERRERRFDGERRERKFDGERRERKFDGERRERKFDGERRERKFDGERRERKFDGERRADSRKPYDRSTEKRGWRRAEENEMDRMREPVSENPLAKRRNEKLLSQIGKAKPTLPNSDSDKKVVMRRRKK